MGLIKIFVTIVLMGILLWFLALNVDQTIQTLQIFSVTLHNVNLVHVILATFLVGILVGFIIPVFQVLNARSDARRFERENRKLRQELNELRNVAIEEEPEPEPAPEKALPPQQEPAPDSTE